MIDVNTFYKKINNSNFESQLDDINNNLSMFMDRENYNVNYRESYIIQSHFQSEKSVADEYAIAKNNIPFRKEEWICKLAVGKTFEEIGEIVDYQVPLKVPGQKSDGRGKVDLLSYSKETNTAYLLEVKVDTSTESPLKAIMEVYTYWQQIGGNNSEKFLSKTIIGCNAKLKKAIIIFENDEKRYLFSKLKKNDAKLKCLMNKLDIECFVAESSLQDENVISSIRRYK